MPYLNLLARKSAFIFIFALAIAGFLTAFPAFAGPYRLVAQDRIALRVVEWRSGEAEFKDWSVLNGAFLINDDGAISIPFVGEVEAAGLTTKELAALIADLLQRRAGLANKPSASVEISQYGPIYVVGAVDKPGQYPFSPDLTVLKAISLAGGFQREPESIGSRLGRDRIQAAGTLGGAELDYNGLFVRRARLQAEKEGKETFDIPEELRGTKGIEELHAEELDLMKLRQIELKSKIAAAKGLGQLYTHEIETLQNKIAAQQRQVTLVKKELSNVNSLVDKGLIQSSRRFSLDRDESDAENKLLDLDFQMIRARQLLEENRRDSEELVNSMNSEIQNELNEVVRGIAKADLQTRVARLLIDETHYEKQRQLLEDDGNDDDFIQFQIARRSESGETTRIAATADTLVEPRDLIEVAPETPRRSKLGMSTPARFQHRVASSGALTR
ncbi:polysaccharide biosynthesis/export family protein [Pararhizobium sp. BT-229]|uniref:polysaccharide biosynthesis/export family protein n=1 Tax=Pararhizobium sp. BT-229 TaxID=2986923 RepID=UPI0021F6E1F4|nr:polysaccharide biosynthesis/export family protein [Pararhizobium sp. BT-229]MCV9967734.1 polysaccharide biosynthesis/export family protein [Pararhizobium sp. BT-229]